jgi:hypothetical protein
MSSFKYEDIPFNTTQQIRLFTLLPSTKNFSADFVEHDVMPAGTLKSVNWTEAPAYTALSYTWGSATSLKTILINDKEFEVTVNLHDALCELQAEKPVCLWIDAICINQHDNPEKNEQVERMTDIYKVATSVFAWLGPAVDGSNDGMDALENIGNDAIDAGWLNLTREIMLKLWDPNPTDLLARVREPFETLSKKLDLDFPQLAIKRITERGYWERTWIAQEFSVASDIVIACGPKRLKFPQLRAGVLFLGMHTTLISKNASAADRADPVRGPALRNFFRTSKGGNAAISSLIGSRRRYQAQTPSNRPSLMELLIKFSNTLKATNPRDRIYGILGLAGDKELGIKVDYNMKIHEVYTMTAEILLQHNYTDILSWCKFPKGQPELPSWVPNFDGLLRDPYGAYKYKGPLWKPLFDASKSHEVKISTRSLIDNSSTITMSGLTLDVIKELGTSWQEPKGENFWQPVKTFLTQIKTFLEQAQKIPHLVPQGQKFWDDAFWRIPCADQKYHGYVRRRADATAEDGLCEVIARMYGDRSGHEDEVKTSAFNKYDGAMGYLYGLKPFISGKGYVGLAPEHAVPGDILCVIIGAIVPYVLRRVPEGGFELVGEAYVHGIMDGEAMDLGLEEELLCLS